MAGVAERLGHRLRHRVHIRRLPPARSPSHRSRPRSSAHPAPPRRWPWRPPGPVPRRRSGRSSRSQACPSGEDRTDGPDIPGVQQRDDPFHSVIVGDDMADVSAYPLVRQARGAPRRAPRTRHPADARPSCRAPSSHPSRRSAYAPSPSACFTRVSTTSSSSPGRPDRRGPAGWTDRGSRGAGRAPRCSTRTPSG